jgi:hypothetical protein
VSQHPPHLPTRTEPHAFALAMLRFVVVLGSCFFFAWAILAFLTPCEAGMLCAAVVGTPARLQRQPAQPGGTDDACSDACSDSDEPPRPDRRSGMLRAAYVTGARRASMAWLLLGMMLGALARHAMGPMT